MRIIRFSNEAINDLEDIAEHIGKDNQEAAARMIARIHKLIHTLADPRFSQMGRQ